MRRLMQTTMALPSNASQSLVEVNNDVLGYLFHPLLRANDRLLLRPLRLEPLGALYLLALGDLLEVRVDLGLLVFVQGRAWRGGSRSRWAPWPCPRRIAGCRRC